MLQSSPVRYQIDVETIEDDESATVADLNKSFDTILETTANDYGRAVRAVHAKAHGVLKGVFTVKPDLPPELAQGMFATPGQHEAFIRISTNAGDILPDDIGLPRGLALKVLGIEGERLSGAEGQTQDFIMVNGPVFQAKTSKKFAADLKLLSKTTDKAEGAKQTMSAMMSGISSALSAVGVVSPTVNSMGGAPNVDPLGETYFSVTPFRYGDYIAKFALVPVSSGLTALTGTKIDAHDRPDAIRQTLETEMPSIDGVWEFRVQLCLDLDKQPIEDPTVEWKKDEAPFFAVATLHVEPQQSWAPEQVKAVDEEMRFSVWTGLSAHQPLGNINRARRDTYQHASDFRASFNRCPINEPTAS